MDPSIEFTFEPSQTLFDDFGVHPVSFYDSDDEVKFQSFPDSTSTSPYDSNFDIDAFELSSPSDKDTDFQHHGGDRGSGDVGGDSSTASFLSLCSSSKHGLIDDDIIFTDHEERESLVSPESTTARLRADEELDPPDDPEAMAHLYGLRGDWSFVQRLLYQPLQDIPLHVISCLGAFAGGAMRTGKVRLVLELLRSHACRLRIPNLISQVMHVIVPSDGYPLPRHAVPPVTKTEKIYYSKYKRLDTVFDFLCTALTSARADLDAFHELVAFHGCTPSRDLAPFVGLAVQARTVLDFMRHMLIAAISDNEILPDTFTSLISGFLRIACTRCEIALWNQILSFLSSLQRVKIFDWAFSRLLLSDARGESPLTRFAPPGILPAARTAIVQSIHSIYREAVIRASVLNPSWTAYNNPSAFLPLEKEPSKKYIQQGVRTRQRTIGKRMMYYSPLGVTKDKPKERQIHRNTKTAHQTGTEVRNVLKSLHKA